MFPREEESNLPSVSYEALPKTYTMMANAITRLAGTIDSPQVVDNIPTGIPHTRNPQISGISRLIQQQKDSVAATIEEARASNYQDCSAFFSDDEDEEMPTPMPTSTAGYPNPNGPSRACNIAFEASCEDSAPLAAQKSDASLVGFARFPAPASPAVPSVAVPARKLPNAIDIVRPAPRNNATQTARNEPLDYFDITDSGTMDKLRREVHCNYMRNKTIDDARDALEREIRHMELVEGNQNYTNFMIEYCRNIEINVNAGREPYHGTQSRSQFMMTHYSEQMVKHCPWEVVVYQTRFMGEEGMRLFLEANSGGRTLREIYESKRQEILTKEAEARGDIPLLVYEELVWPCDFDIPEEPEDTGLDNDSEKSQDDIHLDNSDDSDDSDGSDDSDQDERAVEINQDEIAAILDGLAIFSDDQFAHFASDEGEREPCGENEDYFAAAFDNILPGFDGSFETQAERLALEQDRAREEEADRMAAENMRRIEAEIEALVDSLDGIPEDGMQIEADAPEDSPDNILDDNLRRVETELYAMVDSDDLLGNSHYNEEYYFYNMGTLRGGGFHDDEASADGLMDLDDDDAEAEAEDQQDENTAFSGHGPGPGPSHPPSCRLRPTVINGPVNPLGLGPPLLPLQGAGRPPHPPSCRLRPTVINGPVSPLNLGPPLLPLGGAPHPTHTGEPIMPPTPRLAPLDSLDDDEIPPLSLPPAWDDDEDDPDRSQSGLPPPPPPTPASEEEELEEEYEEEYGEEYEEESEEESEEEESEEEELEEEEE